MRTTAQKSESPQKNKKKIKIESFLLNSQIIFTTTEHFCEEAATFQHFSVSGTSAFVGSSSMRKKHTEEISY